MPIRFACPKCKKQMSVDSKMAGKTGKCACGAAIKIPVPKAAAPAARPQATATAQKQPTATAANQTPDALAGGGGLGNMFDDLTEDDFNRESPFQNVYSPPKAGTSDGKILKRFNTDDDDGEPGKVQAGKLNGTLIFMGIMNSLAAVGLFAFGGLILLSAGLLATVENAMPFSIGLGFVAAIILSFGLFELLSAIGIFCKQKWGYFITTVAQAFGVVFMGGVLVVNVMDGFEMVKFFVPFVLMFGAISSCAFMYKDDTKKIFRIGESSKMPLIAGILGAVIGLSLWGGLFAVGAAAGAALDDASEEYAEELDDEYGG